MRTRMIARAVIVAAVLSTATAALAAGVTLPSKANSHAVQATASVSTGSSNASHGQSDETHPASTPSPNAHAAFGQCVAANAKTASDHAGSGGQTWNPTMGCTKPNSSAGASVNANVSANASATGTEESSEKGANGSENAAANGAAHAAARSANAHH